MARVTEPICRHTPVGYVAAGDPFDLNRAHASHVVCAREACIEDAKFWARALTGEEPQFRLFSGSKPKIVDVDVQRSVL